MLGNQTFQCQAIDFLGSIQRALRPQGTEHAGIEDVELVVGHGLPLRSFAEYRQPVGQQQVLKNLDISRYHLTFDFAVSSDSSNVKLRSMRKTDCFQKSGEVADVSGETFAFHVLIDIEIDVGIEYARSVGRIQHQWQ